MVDIKKATDNIARQLEVYETVIVIIVKGDVTKDNPPMDIIKDKLLNHYIGGGTDDYEFEIGKKLTTY